MQTSIDIGRDLRLTLEADGQWRVVGVAGHWPLDGRRDYSRAVVLLERNYAEVKSAIAHLATQQSTAQPFLLDAIALAGLQSSSDYWASLAMEWVVQLPDEQKQSLEDVLRTVSTAKWAGQKLRQAAKRQLKRPLH